MTSEFERELRDTIYKVDRESNQENQVEKRVAKLALEYAIAVYKELYE